MVKLKSLCETCESQGEKCNVTNQKQVGRMIECFGYTMRDYVTLTDFVEGKNITSKERVPLEVEFKNYAKIIAEKLKEYDKIGQFRVHFAQHMTEIDDLCMKGTNPPKRKLVSLQNFITIASFLLGERISPKDCIEALDNHHEKTSWFSTDRHGNVKNIR